MSYITYGNIKVVSPFEIIHLKELKIHRGLNEHATVNFTGVIPSEKKDSYIKSVSHKDTIEVSKVEDGEIIFRGIVTRMEITAVRGLYYLKIEGKSATYNLDIKIKRRSFQHKEMTYDALIKDVLKDYGGADFINVGAKGMKLEDIFVQYDETDWEFLKRMASHFNSPLVPDILSFTPKFWFGLPQGGSGSLEEYNYSVRKKIGDFRYSSQNFLSGTDETDFTYYEIQTHKILNIGDKIKFNNINLVVSEGTSIMEDGILINTYVITPLKGSSQDLLWNKKIVGVSIEGKVIEIKDDNIRVHMEIDKSQKKDEAFWFHYSTFYSCEGNTGWYCMPELEDSVKVYFPTNEEKDAIVLSTIRRKTKGGDKIKNPDEKFFRTKEKKEKKFTKKELVFSAKDDKVLIRLNEDNGIEISSDSEINIKSNEDLTINGDNIEMKAANNIEIVCKTSTIKMDGETHISGTQVKVRC